MTPEDGRATTETAATTRPTASAADLLGDATTVGAVTLRVADLDAQTAYYRDGALLDTLAAAPGSVVLGRRGVPIVMLEHAPELRHSSPRDAGLFHTAILYPSEADLAAAVYSLARRYPGTFTGSADHLVSEAFYFTDPEGNGVELYRDRARSEWSWDGDSVRMDTLHLDPNAYLRAHLTGEVLDTATGREARVGHVHLAVGDVPTAREFYVDRLGFAPTLDWHGALFVSAGRYHHHLAMNVWNSAGAGRRGRTLGLGLVRIEVETPDELGALASRLASVRCPTEHDGRTLALDDPWGNRIEVTAAT